jgi:4-amino-4-deoxy-L-arabinose transferase-like glycosyltransferase
MDERDETVEPPDAAPSPRRPPPQGYRQGLITAVTVLLGFSLAFLRFWGFEAPGEWTVRSLAAAGAIAGAIVLQLVALARALRVADDDEREFARTVRWLLASAILLLAGVGLALLIDSGVLGGRPRLHVT